MENKMIKLINVYENEWKFSDEGMDFSVYEAIDFWNAGKAEQAIKKLKTILVKNPYYIDAYHHLSVFYEEVGMDFEAYLCCREAVRVGLSIIPNEFCWQSSGLAWMSMENRPFLRAYYNLGLWLDRREETDEAISIFSNILSAGPGDNLGVRYLLPKLWLKKDDLSSVISHCEKFSDDCSPEIMYTYSLALALSGKTEQAQKLLLEAKAEYPLVAKELLKKRHRKPKESPYGGITVGGADQAYLYWKEYGEYWSSPIAQELISTSS